MTDPSKTTHGRPCGKCGGTLRWIKTRDCIPCRRERDRGRVDYYREYRAREREDSLTYFTHLLRHRRAKALKRMAARNAQLGRV